MNLVVNIVTATSLAAILLLCCCPSHITFSEALLLQNSEQRCDYSSDCNLDRICHEHKCICSKEFPVEDQDRCLPQVLIGESCSIQSQCLVDSLCIDGICTCGEEAVSVYNPSSKIFYCQPKRRLEEPCNSDLQCPVNAYCSGDRGCLCSNGYSPANVSQANGQETTECLPKKCTSQSDCEEYHQCDETHKCMCIATHFDVSRARCYKFGGTKLPGDSSSDQNNSSTSADINHQDNNNGILDDFISTLKDLTSINKTSDRKLWLVLIILITLSLLLLILILSLLRKHYLGYCWTAHKKEYEPNNTTAKQPLGGGGGGTKNHFDKNSINNKSFRRRTGEHDSDDSDYEAAARTGNEDKSNLVSAAAAATNGGDFVAVNLASDDKQQLSSEQKRLNYHHKEGPLKSSTSTPV